ncbi:hypothetical protein BC332_03412 [Capsicum chinense]|nr:hypothetical protein BC332_03412 [Capsicum chinense]
MAGDGAGGSSTFFNSLVVGVNASSATGFSSSTLFFTSYIIIAGGSSIVDISFSSAFFTSSTIVGAGSSALGFTSLSAFCTTSTLQQLLIHAALWDLDQRVTCGRPSHDSLWVTLLAFHLALITTQQEAYVVLTFASLLYHGNWKEGVKFARKHSDAASIYAPKILDSQDSISDDELVERVTELAVLLQNSLDILTYKHSLQEAISRFPGSHALVWINAGFKFEWWAPQLNWV